ncbi:glycoside hydrolase [Patescibacteria group bacterium]|nr:glycoside hydrolase [Patescibacteria group bacterium]MBU1663002.1 glycoside hydrolase [Patescibacteria group bacterium]MBU1934174.1 glycoside hydrolase [Patescibacteria group bacterium]MBU2007541.1 glycoside hydrolase [Patescibacteria group bacterium]MBU2233605.1 glycoside hydrolase [Patescibacteria group bacterium]
MKISNNANNNIIEICYEKSIDLLIKNSTSFGVKASSFSRKAKDRNYLSIFGRDASICAIGMAISKNKKLIQSAKNSLISLAKMQAKNGQMPNYIKPELNKADFWYLSCIDATLWWLIAIKHFSYFTQNKKLEKILTVKISKAINWLLSHEHQQFFLLEQNEASDWADIMPRSGYVLYANALWLWVKRLYKIDNLTKTVESFNYIFYPWQKIPNKYFTNNYRAKKFNNYLKQIEKSKYLLSFANYGFGGEEVDVYGNILACLTEAVDIKIRKNIIKQLINDKIDFPYPVKTCVNPITENSKLWREYMKIHKQNYPNQYHNGGIWPFIGSFWAIALNKTGNEKLAEQTLIKLAKANKINDWQFNEWFNGLTGEPQGIHGQSWNAGTFILAYHLIKNNSRLL